MSTIKIPFAAYARKMGLVGKRRNERPVYISIANALEEINGQEYITLDNLYGPLSEVLSSFYNTVKKSDNILELKLFLQTCRNRLFDWFFYTEHLLEALANFAKPDEVAPIRQEINKLLEDTKSIFDHLIAGYRLCPKVLAQVFQLRKAAKTKKSPGKLLIYLKEFVMPLKYSKKQKKALRIEVINAGAIENIQGQEFIDPKQFAESELRNLDSLYDELTKSRSFVDLYNYSSTSKKALDLWINFADYSIEAVNTVKAPGGDTLTSQRLNDLIIDTQSLFNHLLKSYELTRSTDFSKSKQLTAKPK